MNEEKKSSLTSRRNFIAAACGAAGAVTVASTSLAAGMPKNSMTKKSTSRVIEAQEGPSLYKHKSPFSVITIGTGCPEPVLGRSGPCTLVQYKGTYFLCDVGAGTTERLCELGIPLKAVENMFFTHHHPDHNEGYMRWVIASWMHGRKNLSIVGPPKTKKFHETTLGFFEDELHFRNEKLGHPIKAMYTDDIQEFKGSNTFDFKGVKVTTAEMTHNEYCIGFRFDVDGKSIVVSGDTSYDEDLIKLAKGADVLIMDSGLVANNGLIAAFDPLPEGDPNKGKMPPRPPAKTGAPELRVPNHPEPGTVARIAVETNVKKLVFTHYPPFELNEEAILKDIKDAGFKGEVILGKDLLEVTA
jgi:ribonuclease Z